MPKFNHPTFGDVQSHTYLEGKILAVYGEDSAIPREKWDTTDVQYEGYKIYLNAAIRYHCSSVEAERPNGAVTNGARGFDVGDRVILMARIGSARLMGEQYDRMYVMGHINGICPCTYNFLLIRISSSDFLPHDPPYGTWSKDVYGASVYTPNAPNSHAHEYCIVWDVEKNARASITNPITGSPYVFPVTMEALKPVLDYYTFNDEELFHLDSQGDEYSEEAGFTPDWRSDIRGDKIRGGVDPSAWWTTYNFYGNPMMTMMLMMQLRMASDSAGLLTGKFENAINTYAGYEDQIQRWIANSPKACNRDIRLFDIKGSDSTFTMPPDVVERIGELERIIVQMESLMRGYEAMPQPLPPDTQKTYDDYKQTRDDCKAEITAILAQGAFTPWDTAHDMHGKPLQGRSVHFQFAYGEDEIWVCGKNVYQGLVISACDAAWKFQRLSFLPPTIPIGNPAAQRLAGGECVIIGGVAAGLSNVIRDISLMLASDIMIRDDNNIFSYGTLKRINEGCFHRTYNPAMKHEGAGSWRMTQRPIPNSSENIRWYTALNSRKETFEVWSRYDNWMNTIGFSSASWAVDRAWWFVSSAQQWRVKANYIDTPLGSMWHGSPTLEVGLWYATRFQFTDGTLTARKDIPLETQFIRQTKHSQRVCCQIYLVQRQAVSLWDAPGFVFVLQEPLKGPYDCCDPGSIKYTEAGVDYNTLTPQQKAALIGDRVYMRSTFAGDTGYTQPVALRNNRNEVEIMAACDMYSSLETSFGRKNPSDQVRNGKLEKAIASLVAAYYTGEGFSLKDFSEFKMEARIG